MSGIVTNGLIGYWHYKEGFKENTWENIAPNTKGSFNGTVSGAISQSDGIYFDGLDDYVAFNLTSIGEIMSFEIIFTPDHTQSNPSGNLFGKDTSNHILFNKSTSKVDIRRNGTLIASTTSIGNNSKTHVVFTYDGLTTKVYVEGNLSTSTTRSVLNNKLFPQNTDGVSVGAMTSGVFNKYKGKILFVRLYNRTLSDTEILQNYDVGTNIGLESQPNLPVVTKLIVDKGKISDEEAMNQSIITVQFDTNVTEYVAKLNGSDYATGSLVHLGGAVPANTDATVIIDWDELSSEGANRINIYGKSADGQWTPYTPN